MDGEDILATIVLSIVIGLLFFGVVSSVVDEYRVTENRTVPETECLVTNAKAFDYVKQHGDKMGYDEASKQAYELFCAEKEE